MSLEILGYSAIGIAASASIPQLYQIIKTKKVRDLNYIFFFLDAFASFMYILYGILKKDYVMMGSAIVPFTSQIIILFLLCFYKENYENTENT